MKQNKAKAIILRLDDATQNEEIRLKSKTKAQKNVCDYFKNHDETFNFLINTVNYLEVKYTL